MHTIGKAAKLAGLSIDTIRFYEREGLLPKPERTASRYRLYEDSAIARLRFIRRAKTLGFSLQEIRELLLLNDGGGNRRSVRTVGEKRLTEIQQRIDELTRVRGALEHLLKQCDGHGPLLGCPIIEAMVDDWEGVDQRREKANTSASPQNKKRAKRLR